MILADKEAIYFKPQVHCPFGYSLWLASN